MEPYKCNSGHIHRLVLFGLIGQVIIKDCHFHLNVGKVLNMGKEGGGGQMRGTLLVIVEKDVVVNLVGGVKL